MSTHMLQLPRLVAGRDFADDMVESLGPMIDDEVIVDASRLLSGTPSFAAELVRQVIIEGRARSLLLVGAPADFVGYTGAAAQDLGVRERFDAAEHLPYSAVG